MGNVYQAISLNKNKITVEIYFCISHEENSPLTLLIEIYGDDMEAEFSKISAFKYSFIDWVDYYLIKKANDNEVIIPKTFKLLDIPVFNRTYESRIGFHHRSYELSNNPSVQQ